jgi:polyhydroxyalkanoate synthesis regulator phasin
MNNIEIFEPKLSMVDLKTFEPAKISIAATGSMNVAEAIKLMQEFRQSIEHAMKMNENMEYQISPRKQKLDDYVDKSEINHDFFIKEYGEILTYVKDLDEKIKKIEQEQNIAASFDVGDRLEFDYDARKEFVRWRQAYKEAEYFKFEGANLVKTKNGIRTKVYLFEGICEDTDYTKSQILDLILSSYDKVFMDNILLNKSDYAGMDFEDLKKLNKNFEAIGGTEDIAQILWDKVEAENER